MSELINFYDIIGPKYTNDNYYNPNVKKGAIQHPARVCIIGTTGSMKTNTCFNIITTCSCFDKIYLYARDLSEPLYKWLIDTMEKEGDDIEYSSEISDIPNLDEIDPTIQNLIIFDDMVCEDLKKQKKLKELFIRGRKINCTVIFITQDYFTIPKIIRNQCSCYILKKINNNDEIKSIIKKCGLDKTVSEVVDMYDYATAGQIDSFMIDALNPDPRMRYRKNLIPIELAKQMDSKKITAKKDKKQIKP